MRTVAIAICGLIVVGLDAQQLSIDDRIAGGLWGLFVGDALAMPVHWYYGGPEQIRQNYHGSLLSGYERAVHPFPESIMQLSNTGGAGRGSNEGDIIGSVILHDKKEYWQRGSQHHYHHTLAAGENTLEASLARVLMQSLSSDNGSFLAETFRTRYISFMTTPGTHNDTYASTCHRMFFKNWAAGVAPEKCPSNDGHNVDTMDGLVLPMVVLIVELGSGRSVAEASKTAAEALSVSRQSTKLLEYIGAAAEMLSALLAGHSIDKVVQDMFPHIPSEVSRRDTDPMVACYIDGGFPALLFFAYKYGKLPVGEALLASANAGGENVHRGGVLGALLGFASGEEGVSEKFRKGLVAHSALKDEVANLVGLVRKRREQHGTRPEL